jgi:hypothetical protein
MSSFLACFALSHNKISNQLIVKSCALNYSKFLLITFIIIKFLYEDWSDERDAATTRIPGGRNEDPDFGQGLEDQTTALDFLTKAQW